MKTLGKICSSWRWEGSRGTVLITLCQNCSKTHFYQATVTNSALKGIIKTYRVLSNLSLQNLLLWMRWTRLKNSGAWNPGKLVRNYFPHKQDSFSSKDLGTLEFYFKATFEVYFKAHISYGFWAWMCLLLITWDPQQLWGVFCFILRSLCCSPLNTVHVPASTRKEIPSTFLCFFSTSGKIKVWLSLLFYLGIIHFHTISTFSRAGYLHINNEACFLIPSLTPLASYIKKCR